MDASAKETLLKKKLQAFLAEMLKFGSIKGFKHFAMYLRGREELVISVSNEPKSPQHSYTIENTAQNVPDPSRSSSLTSNNLPYDKRSLLLSLRSQMNLTTTSVPKGVGLPPASPSDSETQAGDERSTLFLLAGYARYCCPYVWVRSNHERLIKLTGDTENEKDSPLRLKTTTLWKDSDIYMWDVIAELVKLNTYPAPINPFEIDFDYFSSLPLEEQILSTAAMVQCLQKIVLKTPDEKLYAGRVFDDLQHITKLHFTALQNQVKSHGLPVLECHNQAMARSTGHQARSGQRPRYDSGSRYDSGPGTRYPSGPQYSHAPGQYGASYSQPSSSYSYSAY